jgi:hypothetical protein
MPRSVLCVQVQRTVCLQLWLTLAHWPLPSVKMKVVIGLLNLNPPPSLYFVTAGLHYSEGNYRTELWEENIMLENQDSTGMQVRVN